MNIIGMVVFVREGDDVRIEKFTWGDFEAEAELFAGAYDDALIVPLTDVLIITD